MKAIIVTPGKAGATLADIPDTPDTGIVKVRTLHTGICGTDREIYAGKLGITRVEKGQTLVLGHEAIGVVESAPSKSGFELGQIVVPMVRRPGGCVNCLKGRQDYCTDGNFTEAGIRGKDGFMREHFYERPEFLIKVGDPSNASICTLTEPTKNIMKILEAINLVAKRSLSDLSNGMAGKNVWIFGTGAEGLLAAAVFKDAGANIMIVNRRPASNAERTIISGIGAGFFNSSTDDWTAALKSTPMEIALDMVGVPEIFEVAIKELSRNGIIVLFGTGGQGKSMQLDGSAIIHMVDKNATVVGCEDGARKHYEEAVEFLERCNAKYGLSNIITGHYTSSNLSVLEKKGGGEIKSVIDW
ncbi:MAG: alcohol dehydrogenase catalytic domain-containing protein [Candidatus Micrarchaeota archaeon]|nr:alcohol dehydrogenase catalytic domain-containing protein [Candidatus Micrarchaeota archaeon]MDE1847773.1 alcohol dehydrogenase catalytic domain-containing protein [Candidatus Micrarchaeota archaeon]MDE1864211.1 alcohol dehydrogenase catalytic domain-containing protein [Candidatus Micrarchaeota archaeon]